VSLSTITQDVSVLINSCDKYADVWPVFFALFWKYWPDCPFPVYLGTNSRTWLDERVRVIKVGSDISWAETTLRMVSAVPTPYILWFLDDFLVWKHVDTPTVQSLFVEMKQLNADYLRLRPLPRPDWPVPGHPRIGQIRPGAPYRCALEIAFWRREVLMDLLAPGESPWDMEKAGSRRSDERPGFYSTWKPVFKRTNGLERGKWILNNLPRLKREGISIPPDHVIMTLTEQISYWLRFHIYHVVLRCKTRLERFMEFFRIHG